MSKNKRLVWTNAFLTDWIPVEENPNRPFLIVASIDLEDLGNGKTKYIATARHWTVQECKKHEEMGYHQVSEMIIDQLV
jgi:hypothetical protein